MPGIGGKFGPDYAPDSLTKHNWQYVIAKVDKAKLGIDRDSLVKALEAENILARRYFYPGCHNMHPYKENFPNNSLILPNTEALTSEVISFPTGQSVGVANLELLSTCLYSIYQAYQS